MTREESESIVVTVTCGSCGMKLQAPASADGRTIKCTRCGANLRVHLPSGPAPAAPAASPGALIPEARPVRPASPVSPVPATSEPHLAAELSPAPESTPVPQSPLRPTASLAMPEGPPPAQWQLANESAPTGTPDRRPWVAGEETGVESSAPMTFGTLPPSPVTAETAAAEPEELAAWADIRKLSAAAASAPAPDPGPAVTEHVVPQKTFTDAAIADEAIPSPGAAAGAAAVGADRAPDVADAPPKAPTVEKPASARRTPDPIDASRADAALLLMGVERSTPATPVATTTSATTTAADAGVSDESGPGTRPHFRREYSAPALPEPIPAMAVLPAQPKAPYLPAATLPPAIRQRAAAGQGTPAGQQDRSAEEDDASRGESALAAWFRALVLTGAVVIIGAIAWAAADRIGGIRNWWVVKFACIAWLIGMGTATAMISSRRTGAGAKLFSILAASLAIVLGKAVILCLPQVPAELMNFDDPQRWARTFAQMAFIPVDPLFFAMAITGSAVRFILSRRED